MSALKERLAQQAKVNPAEGAPITQIEPERIPMSTPQQRLSAPDIPGFHTHWFIGQPDRIERALRAGYQFVEQEEIGILNRDLAGDNKPIGGTDLGTRVSVVAGGVYEGTSTAQRLYLMKIPQELWEQDQKTLAAVNERIASTLRGDGLRDPSGDNTHRYRGDDANQKKTLFHPKN